MSALGLNTESARDLKARATEIAGKLRLQAQAKRQAKILGEEITALYKLASSSGYDKAVLKGRIVELMMESDQLEMHFDAERDQAEIIETYRHALGLLEDDDDPGSTNGFMADVDAKLRAAGYSQDDSGAWFKTAGKTLAAAVDEINTVRKGRLRGVSVELPEPVEA